MHFMWWTNMLTWQFLHSGRCFQLIMFIYKDTQTKIWLHLVEKWKFFNTYVTIPLTFPLLYCTSTFNYVGLTTYWKLLICEPLNQFSAPTDYIKMICSSLSVVSQTHQPRHKRSLSLYSPDPDSLNNAAMKPIRPLPERDEITIPPSFNNNACGQLG